MRAVLLRGNGGSWVRPRASASRAAHAPAGTTSPLHLRPRPPQLRWWHMLDERGGFEAHGTGRDGLVLEAASNRAAGQSLLHTVDNVLTSFPSPF